MTTPWDKQHNQQKRWRIEPMDESLHEFLHSRYASYFWPDEEDWFVVAKRSSHLGVTSVQFTPMLNPPRWERPELKEFYPDNRPLEVV